VATSSTKGWTKTDTINQLGLLTQSTFGPATNGPDAFTPPPLTAAWRVDGSLSSATHRTGTVLQPRTAATTADFGPDGRLTGLIVPLQGNIFGSHSFDPVAKTETVILGGIKTVRAIDGTSLSQTKAPGIPDSAAPHLTPGIRTVASAGPTSEDFTLAIAPTAAGSPTEITLNPAGAPVKHGYAAGFAPETTWLAGGLPAAVTCARGGSIGFGYSDTGARDLLSITYPEAENEFGGLTSYATHSFTYYPSGNPHTITDGSGIRTLTYQNGRLHTVTATGHPLGGYLLTRDHDSSGRLETLTLTRDGETLSTRTIGYNGVSGEPATITAPGFAATYSRTCPDTRAITGVSRWVGAPPALAQTWTRGTAGRIQGASAAGLTYTHTAWDPRARRENMVTPIGTWSYEYNPYGQLKKATRGTTVLNYTFDAIGRRNAVNQGNTLNQFTDLANPTFKNLHITAASTSKVSIDGGTLTPFTGFLLHPLANPDPVNGTGGWVPWTVRGVIDDGGDHAPTTDATAVLSGWSWFPPADETITYDDSGNRESTALWTYRWNSRNH
jgi:hypothetical protein